MPIDPETVLGWLRRAGLPLEYEAARQLRGVGFVAEQGLHYPDPTDERTSREIDVVARAAISGTTAMHLVVECKVRKASPWVIMTTDSVRTPQWQPIASLRLQELLRKPQWAPELAEALPLSRPMGFRAIEAKQDDDRDRRDFAHVAMEQAVSGAVGLIETIEVGPAFVLPVVVVDTDLFQLSVPEPGKEELRPIDWHRVRWHGAQAHQKPTAVDVVRASFLPLYAGQIRSAFDAAVKVCDAALGSDVRHSKEFDVRRR